MAPSVASSGEEEKVFDLFRGRSWQRHCDFYRGHDDLWVLVSRRKDQPDQTNGQHGENQRQGEARSYESRESRPGRFSRVTVMARSSSPGRHPRGRAPRPGYHRFTRPDTGQYLDMPAQAASGRTLR